MKSRFGFFGDICMENIKIRPNTKIGQLDAENDASFLTECFIDNGLIDTLCDSMQSEAIILGRTGAGKTATLMHINEIVDKDNSKLIDLEDIFLNYLDNSNVIKFLRESEVNLEVFYKYLWRHIITVEFIKLKYPQWNSNNKLSNFINELANIVKKPQERVAFDYLKKWSDKYWIETDENIKEIVRTLTTDIKAGFESENPIVNITLEGAKELSEEKKIEVQHRAQKIINSIQISDLSNVIKLMNDYIFNDSKNTYFLLIDKIDENWASIDIKYDLIKALIEEIRHFRNINNVKIIVSLRVDLYQLTLEKTRSNGFQEDKLQSLIYKLRWEEEDLKEIVDKRIQFLYQNKYTRNSVVFEDIFPATNKKGDAWSYLIQRTFLRPRDILQLVNYCLSNSVNKVSVDWGAIVNAEKEYSRDRLKALYEEWYDIFPSLEYLVPILLDIPNEQMSADELRERINDEVIIKIYQDLAKNNINDSISSSLQLYWEQDHSDITDFRNEIISCFYRTGLIGLSEDYPDSFDWSFKDVSYKSNMDCRKAKWAKVHKMFHHALHIKE